MTFIKQASWKLMLRKDGKVCSPLLDEYNDRHPDDMHRLYRNKCPHCKELMGNCKCGTILVADDNELKYKKGATVKCLKCNTKFEHVCG